MRVLIFAVMLCYSLVGWSNEIAVGGVKITIPDPQGYSAVTPDMVVLYEVQKQFVAPVNDEFITFIPEAQVAMVLRDDIPDLPRRFAVQTAKNIVNLTATTSDFASLKDIIKHQNAAILEKAKAQLPELMDKVNNGIKEQYDVDLALSVSQMIPMPAHQESERTLSYSSLVKYDMQDESGNPVPFVSAVTATFVHVKGKILFLYTYAEESGLVWSQQAAEKWARDIVNANPSDFETSIKESVPSSLLGIDWGQVGSKAVAGALIGLIIGLIAWCKGRSNKR